MSSAKTASSPIVDDDAASQFNQITREIVEQYKADDRVWVIGFSGTSSEKIV